MTDHKLSDAEALALWRRAEQRLRLLDTEPPVKIDQVDALLRVVGPRRPGEALGDWLMRSQAPQTTAGERPSAEIIPFSPPFNAKRQRFTPVAEIVRLAADSAGREIALPSRELETADGRFRLKVTSEGDQVVIEIQALGHAADEFAGRTIGLAPAGGAPEPVAVLQLDDDGDGRVRLPDAPALRVALLSPVIGVVEDV
ncbi:MAG: hypothetical protein K0R41_514 [Geminicoccaceae bacterium]|jgi:hypothetical protein|nr:hypothetical protein [Geminicoccaceae bacterium]MDF2780676.1 hypothetical protein [Geminicoccaceae bacterium]